MLERRLDFVPRHLEAAGDWPGAIVSWRKAGQNAAARSAVAEAVQHFSHALELCLRQPAGTDRDETELVLRTELSFPLLAMRGWSSKEVAEHVDRAIALSASVEARHRIVPVLIGKWLTGFGSTTGEAMWALVHQIVDAARGGGEVERLLTHRVLSSQYLFEGSLRESLREFQAFKDLYVAEQHEMSLARSGATTHAVTIDMGLATCFALMGRLDEMQSLSTAAMEAARQTGHFNTMCQTLAAAGGFCSALVRDAGSLALYAFELAELAERHDLPFWRPHANLLEGLATAMRGESGPGLGLACQGIDALVAQKAFALSAWVLFYAAACEDAGDTAELGRALAIAQSVIGSGERWFEAEFFRLRGRLQIASGDARQACEDFSKALEIARTQGAGLFEQRAASDLRRFC
jgi:hypothetical protein